jgi:hypothetical protein
MNKIKKVSIVLLIMSFFFAFCGCNSQEEKGVKDAVNNANTTVNSTAKARTDTLNQNETDYIIEDLKGAINTYTDERYEFQVDFPAKWSYIISDSWGSTHDKRVSYEEALKDVNGRFDPTGGIIFYLGDDKEDGLSIYGEDGHAIIQQPNSIAADFTTKSGLIGGLYSSLLNNKMDIYLNITDSSLKNYLGAHISASKECFKRNEKEIFGILRSIRKSGTAK